MEATLLTRTVGRTRSVTTPLNGGNASAGAFADPNGGIGAQIGTGNSRRTPGTQQQGPVPGPVPVRAARRAPCTAGVFGGRDTIIFEMPVGASNGFTCVAPTGSSTPDSLAGFALAAESSIPWPRIAIGANPNDPATVAVPTYYWVSGYNGSPRSVGISATVQEGERCTPTFETNPDGTRTETGQDCVPNMVTYGMVVTARPTTYTWNFGDNQKNPNKDGQQSVVTKPGPEGLGMPYQAPNWSSPIMHLFNVSSYQLEAEGGFPITLTVTYQVDWEAARRRLVSVSRGRSALFSRRSPVRSEFKRSRSCAAHPPFGVRSRDGARGCILGREASWRAALRGQRLDRPGG